MTREEHYQRLQDLCSEVNEAERQLLEEMVAVHDAGWAVTIRGPRGERRLDIYVPREGTSDEK